MSNDYRATFKDLNFSLPEKPPPEKPPVVDRTNCTKCKKCKQIGVKAYSDHWGMCLDCGHQARTPINWIVALKDFALWVAMALYVMAAGTLIVMVTTVGLMVGWLLVFWPFWVIVWLQETYKLK